MSFDEDPQAFTVHGIKKSPGRSVVGIFSRPPVTSRPGSKWSIVIEMPSQSVPEKKNPRII